MVLKLHHLEFANSIGSLNETAFISHSMTTMLLPGLFRNRSQYRLATLVVHSPVPGLRGHPHLLQADPYDRISRADKKREDHTVNL